VPCFVGIDVAQAQLDSAIRPTGERWTVPHDARGVATLVDRVPPLQPPLMVLEATGGLERLVTSALATAGRPVVVVKPRQVRDVARATGQLAQTDAVDARALAHVADAIRPQPRPVPDAQTQELRTLRGRRQQLVAMRPMEQNRLAGTSGRLQRDIPAPITWLHERRAPLDDDLDTVRRSRPLWRENADRWRSAPGIGPVCARTWWLALPALGTLTRQKIATGVGVAPRNCDSGTLCGRRMLWGGPGCARCSLWRRWWPRATTRGSKPFTNGCSRRGR
jgi:transposase